jgi:hypothetical protein
MLRRQAKHVSFRAHVAFAAARHASRLVTLDPKSSALDAAKHGTRNP